MATPSTELQNKLELILQNHGVVIRINSGRRGGIAFNRWRNGNKVYTSGLTDLFFAYNGVVYAIEIKSEKDNLSSEQELFKQAWECVKCRHLVVKSIKQFVEQLAIYDEQLANLLKYSYGV